MVRRKTTYKYRKVQNLTDNPTNVGSKDADVFFVLDEDPVKAARSLVIKHVAKHAKWIAESLTFKYLIDYDVVKEMTIKANYRFKPFPFIYRTPYNINFFSQMYEELVNIYHEYCGLWLPKPRRFEPEEMLYNFRIATYTKDKSTELYLPDYLPCIKKKKPFAKYNILGIDNPSNSKIDVQRLMYIIDGHALDKFPCGAPEWYSPMCREVYRKYDRLSKKTFIILVDTEGKYRYYFQHISDNAREITDIKDMRELIDSFLYQT